MLLVRPGSVPTRRMDVSSEGNLYAIELTEEFEVAFSTDELVEADVRLDGHTRTGVAQVWVIT